MPRQINWQQDHTLEDLETAMRAANDQRHQRRLWAIWQLKQGRSAPEIAAELAVQPRSVYAWVRRYQQGGLEGLLPRAGQGRSEKIDIDPQKLQTFVQKRHFANLSEIQVGLAQEFGISYTPSGIWHLLKRHGIPWKPKS